MNVVVSFRQGRFEYKVEEVVVLISVGKDRQRSGTAIQTSILEAKRMSPPRLMLTQSRQRNSSAARARFICSTFFGAFFFSRLLVPVTSSSSVPWLHRARRGNAALLGTSKSLFSATSASASLHGRVRDPLSAGRDADAFDAAATTPEVDGGDSVEAAEPNETTGGSDGVDVAPDDNLDVAGLSSILSATSGSQIPPEPDEDAPEDDEDASATKGDEDAPAAERTESPPAPEPDENKTKDENPRRQNEKADSVDTTTASEEPASSSSAVQPLASSPPHQKDLCSQSAQRPVPVAAAVPCPTHCPFAQPLLSGTCDKFCVTGDNCSLFHPARSFPDALTHQCVLPCGSDVIEGCVECAGEGRCAKCAVGLLGVSFYELSPDGKRCINQASSTFNVVTFFLAFFAGSFVLYLVHLQSRPITNLESLRYAMRNRLQAKWAYVYGGLRTTSSEEERRTGDDDEDHVAEDQHLQESGFFSNFAPLSTGGMIVGDHGTAAAQRSRGFGMPAADDSAADDADADSDANEELPEERAHRLSIMQEFFASAAARVALAVSATRDRASSFSTSSENNVLRRNAPRWYTARVHSEDIAGKGVAVYFNWVIFMFALSLIMAGVHFVCYENSELALSAAVSEFGAHGQGPPGPHHQHRACSYAPPGSSSSSFSASVRVPPALLQQLELDEQFGLQLRQVPSQDLPAGQIPAGYEDPDPAARNIFHDNHRYSPAGGGAGGAAGAVEGPTLEDAIYNKIYEFMDFLRDAVNRLRTEATKYTTLTPSANLDVRAKYEDFYVRMFVCCGMLYFLVLFSILSFHAAQLEKVAKPFDERVGNASDYCLVVDNLPTHVLDGRVVSAFLEQKLTHLLKAAGYFCEEAETGTAGPGGGEPTNKNKKTEGVKIIGTSIAYDFYAKKGEVYEECLDWLDFNRNLEDSLKNRLHASVRGVSSVVGSPRITGGAVASRSRSVEEGGAGGGSSRSPSPPEVRAPRVVEDSPASSPRSDGGTARNRFLPENYAGEAADEPETAVAGETGAPGGTSEDVGSASQSYGPRRVSGSTISSPNNAPRGRAKQAKTDACGSGRTRLGDTTKGKIGSQSRKKLITTSVQTDALSSEMFDTLVELDEAATKVKRLERRNQLALIDGVFLSLVGLKESRPLPLKNTGRAYVVFEKKEDVARILLLADRLAQKREYERWKRGENLLLHRRAAGDGVLNFDSVGPLFPLFPHGRSPDHGATRGAYGGSAFFANIFGSSRASAGAGEDVRAAGGGNQCSTRRVLSRSMRSMRLLTRPAEVEELLRVENARLEVPLDMEPPSPRRDGGGRTGIAGADRNFVRNTTPAPVFGRVAASTSASVAAASGSATALRLRASGSADEEDASQRRCSTSLYYNRVWSGNQRPGLFRSLRYSDMGEEEQMHASGSYGTVTTSRSISRDVSVSANASEHETVFPHRTSKDTRTPAPPKQEPALDYLTLSSAKEEDPALLHWENFTSWGNFYQKIFFGVFILLFTMFAWTALYLTYAIFYITLIPNIPGLGVAHQTWLKDMLLGVLIVLGNGLLYFVIDKVTRSAGYRTRDGRDKAVLSASFVGTFLNVVCDLAMVAYVARTQHLESVFSGADPTVAYDQVLGGQLFSLIMPGYLILPFLGAPLIEHVIPFWLSFWFIRSRSGILGRDATEALKSPDFQIAWRYADILNNLSICFTLFFFPGPNAWRIMLSLALFTGLIYTIDRYLFFRQTTMTYYPTMALCNSFAEWLVVPSGILSVAFAYWGTRAFPPEEAWLFRTLLGTSGAGEGPVREVNDVVAPGDEGADLPITGGAPETAMLSLDTRRESGATQLFLQLPYAFWVCVSAFLLHCVVYLSLVKRMNKHFRAFSSLGNMRGRHLLPAAELEDEDERQACSSSSRLDRDELDLDERERSTAALHDESQLPANRHAEEDDYNANTSGIAHQQTSAQGSVPIQMPAQPSAKTDTDCDRYCDCVLRQYLRAPKPEVTVQQGQAGEQAAASVAVSHRTVPTYFNTNPIYCLRSRYLGPEASGWRIVRKGLRVADETCFPFMRGTYPNFSNSNT